MSIPVHPSKALQFFDVVGRLKTLKRTGWVNNRKFDKKSFKLQNMIYFMYRLGSNYPLLELYTACDAIIRVIN